MVRGGECQALCWGRDQTVRTGALFAPRGEPELTLASEIARRPSEGRKLCGKSRVASSEAGAALARSIRGTTPAAILARAGAVPERPRGASGVVAPEPLSLRPARLAAIVGAKGCGLRRLRLESHPSQESDGCQQYEHELFPQRGSHRGTSFLKKSITGSVHGRRRGAAPGELGERAELGAGGALW